MQTGYSLLDSYVIFLMQSSEFTKTLSFGSNFKKTAKKNLKLFIFHLKTGLYRYKNIFFILK